MEEKRHLALEGIIVCDLTRAMAGPVCTRLLAQMGAEVIKVEGPDQPDMGRMWPPFADDDQSTLNRSGFFTLMHGNEKDVLLDLKKPEDMAILKRLIKVSDVVMDNFAPRVMPSLGLGYEEIKKIKPDIIMVSESGFGTYGPERERVAFAQILGGSAGADVLDAYPDSPPIFGGNSDQFSALTSAFAIMAALHHRDLTGEGQFIDVAEAETLMAATPRPFMEYIMTGRVPAAQGNRDNVHAPQGCYRCRGEDRWVAISVGNDSEWQSLCQVMGRPELVEDDRFHDAFSRLQHQDDLDEIISAWTINENSSSLMHRLQAVNVAATHVNDGVDIHSDPHLKARETFTVVEHPEQGKREITGLFAKFSATPGVVRRDPLFGEHTDWLLKEFLPAHEGK